MTHNDFKDDDSELLELYAVKRHFKVENEGDPDYFFDGVAKDDNEQAEKEVLPQVIDDNRKCTKDTFKGSLFGCQENVSNTTLTIV